MNVHWFSSQSLMPLISFIFKQVACLRARSEEFESQVPPTQLPSPRLSALSPFNNTSEKLKKWFWNIREPQKKTATACMSGLHSHLFLYCVVKDEHIQIQEKLSVPTVFLHVRVSKYIVLLSSFIPLVANLKWARFPLCLKHVRNTTTQLTYLT